MFTLRKQWHLGDYAHRKHRFWRQLQLRTAQNHWHGPTTTNNTSLVNIPVVIQASNAGTNAGTAGDFASYNATTGFTTATGETTHSGAFTTTTNEISNITGSFAETGSQTNNTIAGLRVGAVTLTIGSGGTGQSLTVGNSSGKTGQVILNGGTIASATANSTNQALAFGNSEGTIYTSTANGTIGAEITGTVGLTTFGPGVLSLTNSNNSFSGGININQGTLNASSNGALGNTSQTMVFNGGTFQFGGAFNPSTTCAITLNAAGGTIDVQAQTPTIGSTISGTGSLTTTDPAR